jgi:Flp pilus assembly pilin Flp
MSSILRTPMNRLCHATRAFVGQQCGVTAIEYALLASLIALTMTAGLALTGTRLDSVFSSIAQTVSDPSGSAGAGTGANGGNGKGNGSGNGNSGGNGNGGPGTGIGGGNGGG